MQSIVGWHYTLNLNERNFHLRPDRADVFRMPQGDYGAAHGAYLAEDYLETTEHRKITVALMSIFKVVPKIKRISRPNHFGRAMG